MSFLRTITNALLFLDVNGKPVHDTDALRISGHVDPDMPAWFVSKDPRCFIQNYDGMSSTRIASGSNP